MAKPELQIIQHLKSQPYAYYFGIYRSEAQQLLDTHLEKYPNGKYKLDFHFYKSYGELALYK